MAEKKKNKAFEIFLLEMSSNPYLEALCCEESWVGELFKDYRLKLIV